MSQSDLTDQHNPGMSKAEIQVLEAVPSGKGDARPVASIATDLDMSDSDTTKRQVREIIKGLIVDHEQPIGSCSKGYFLIETNEELEDYLDDLRQRKRGIQQRIHAIRTAYQSENDSQHTLF